MENLLSVGNHRGQGPMVVELLSHEENSNMNFEDFLVSISHVT
jgi:hypothetical protein